VHVVGVGRHMPEDRVRQLADGRVYSGTEAKALGLVDEIGYLDDAIHCAKSMANLCDARIVAYDRGGGYRGSIYSALPTIPSNINVHVDVPGLSHNRGAAFQYVWEPGVIH
jgi:protease-4